MSKTKTAQKTTTTKPEAYVPRIEDRLFTLQRKLRLMRICFDAHFNQAENIDDVMEDLDDLARACQVEVRALHKAPADVLNWSPEKGGGR